MATAATAAPSVIQVNSSSERDAADSSDTDQEDAPSALQPLATCYESVIVAAAKLKQVLRCYTSNLLGNVRL
jgi:hypothetical protein